MGGEIRALLLHRIGCDFLLEFPCCGSLERFFMTGYGKFILSLPADVPSLRNFFPCYTHSIGNRDVLVMLEYRWVKRYLVAHHGYHAHAFRPGADDYVRVAQADAVRGQCHGLQSGCTKAIDGHPGHAIR